MTPVFLKQESRHPDFVYNVSAQKIIFHWLTFASEPTGWEIICASGIHFISEHPITEMKSKKAWANKQEMKELSTAVTLKIKWRQMKSVLFMNRCIIRSEWCRTNVVVNVYRLSVLRLLSGRKLNFNSRTISNFWNNDLALREIRADLHEVRVGRSFFPNFVDNDCCIVVRDSEDDIRVEMFVVQIVVGLLAWCVNLHSRCLKISLARLADK